MSASGKVSGREVGKERSGVRDLDTCDATCELDVEVWEVNGEVEKAEQREYSGSVP
jgi:hypothetical protein